MAYSYGTDYSKCVHTLTVNGKLSTEAARLLIECEEKIYKLGFVTNLVLSVNREEADVTAGTPKVLAMTDMEAR